MNFSKLLIIITILSLSQSSYAENMHSITLSYGSTQTTVKCNSEALVKMIEVDFSSQLQEKDNPDGTNKSLWVQLRQGGFILLPNYEIEINSTKKWYNHPFSISIALPDNIFCVVR